MGRGPVAKDADAQGGVVGTQAVQRQRGGTAVDVESQRGRTRPSRRRERQLQRLPRRPLSLDRLASLAFLRSWTLSAGGGDYQLRPLFVTPVVPLSAPPDLT